MSRTKMALRRLVLAVAIMLFSSAGANAFCTAGYGPGTIAYEGRHPEHGPVRIAIEFDTSDEITVQYVFLDSGAPLNAHGTINAEYRLLLDLMGSDGAVSALFSEGVATDNCDSFIGIWRDDAGVGSAEIRFDVVYWMSTPLARRYAVAGALDAAAIERRAVAFRDVVLRGDRDAVTQAVRYPVSVYKAPRRVSFGDALGMKVSYDCVFHPVFREQIRRSFPVLMFARDSGISLGNGLVWFDDQGAVIALNNQPFTSAEIEADEAEACEDW